MTNTSLEAFMKWFYPPLSDNLCPANIRTHVMAAVELIRYLDSKGIPSAELTPRTVAEHFARADCSYEVIQEDLTLMQKVYTFLRELGLPVEFSKTYRTDVLQEIIPLRKSMGLGELEVPEKAVISEQGFSRVIGALLNHRNSEAYLNVPRSVVAASIAYRTGARVKEIVQLNDRDLIVFPGEDSAAVEVRFKHSPTRQYSAQGNEQTELETYHQALKEFKARNRTGRTVALLVNRNGTRISSRRLGASLVEICESAGLPDITPNLLRRSYIRNALMSGMNEDQIREVLGSKDNRHARRMGTFDDSKFVEIL